MSLGSVWQRRTWFIKDMGLGELRGIRWDANCLTHQICWHNDWPKRTLSLVWPWSWLCVDNQCFYQKSGWAIVISRSTRFRCSIGSVCAPDKAALTAENHALQCTTGTVQRYLLFVAWGRFICGFRPDLVWFHSIRFAAHYRVQHGRPRFANDLRKSRWLVGTTALLSLLFLPFGNKSYFFLPWPFTRRSHSRASRVSGPITRHRVVDILRHMKIVSCASRPELLVGFLRILFSVMCAAQRFHTDEHDHTYRIGCPDEPDSVTHFIECPKLCSIFISF